MSISEIWSQLVVLFSEPLDWHTLLDILDILIVAFLIYEVILLVRHTRAAQLAKGIVILLASYVVANLLGLRALTLILQNITQYGIVVLAVIFQPELRRAIEQVGSMNSPITRFFGRENMTAEARQGWQNAIVSLCDAAEALAETRTGALIVLERRVNLNEIIRTGTAIRGDISVEGMRTIFYVGTPLHDGAAVVRDARIEAAGCFLPLSNNLEISKDMGTRHRAALGMSENSDAIVVVVSEETGIISLAKNGVLIRRLDRQNLFSLLSSEMLPPPQEQQPTLGRRMKDFFSGAKSKAKTAKQQPEKPGAEQGGTHE